MTALPAPLSTGGFERPHAVPFATTLVSPEARSRVQDVLASGWITTGPETAQFEAEFAAYLGARHAVAVSSCTVGIELALRALRLPVGALVLTPTLTFCGAVHAIVHAGLQPVLVDVDPVTLVPRPDQVAAAADGHRISAMVVQHMAGYPAPVDELAKAASLPLERVVEDAAHGLGSALGTRVIGTISGFTCFSFYATKNLPIGEGGAITVADAELAERLRTLRLHGMTADAWRRYLPGGSWAYSVDTAGLKANMSDVHAAIGLGQLLHLDRWQRRRRELAECYDRQLGEIPGIGLPARPTEGRHAWHLYVIRILESCAVDRDTAAQRLAEQAVATSVHFMPVHMFPYFRSLFGDEACARLTEADRVFPQLLSLPLHPGLSEEDVSYVCHAMAAICASTARAAV